MILKPALVAALTIGTVCCAQDKGRCPSHPERNLPVPNKVALPPPPSPDKKYFVTVLLLTVISNKGYVCSTQVLRGINSEFNNNAEERVRQWHLVPATKGGRTVTGTVFVEVNYWTTSTGEV